MPNPYEGDSDVANQPGIVGTNTAGGDGVSGKSEGNDGQGAGVAGVSSLPSGYGVWGNSDQYIGVSGYSSSGNGVFGGNNSDTKAGVSGYSNKGVGVEGVSDSGTGVLGSSVSGAAGLFYGKVEVTQEKLWARLRTGRGFVPVLLSR
jgi:hypothetical protein